MQPTTDLQSSGPAASAVVGSSPVGPESFRYAVSYWTLEQYEAMDGPTCPCTDRVTCAYHAEREFWDALGESR